MPQLPPCRLCGSEKTQICHTQRELALNCIGDGDALLECEEAYYVCKVCGTVAQVSPPTFDDVARYYASIKVIDQGVRLEYKRAVHLDRVHYLLETTQLTEGRVIDVGAGDAAFLKLLGEEASALQLTGIEASEEGAQKAQTDYGIPMITGSLEDLDLAALNLVESFDLVTSMHALEHTATPAAFLEKMVSLVKLGGYFYLEIPSMERGHQISDSVIGTIVHRGHISHFTGAGLAKVLSELGITLLEQKHTLAHAYPSLQLLGRKLPVARMAQHAFSHLIEQIDADFVAAASRLEALRSQYDSIALWGVGSDLYKVLRHLPTPLDPARTRLIDGNPNKQGKQLFNLPITSPDAANTVECVILASSNLAICMDIQRELKNRYPNLPCQTLFANTSNRLQLTV